MLWLFQVLLKHQVHTTAASLNLKELSQAISGKKQRYIHHGPFPWTCIIFSAKKDFCKWQTSSCPREIYFQTRLERHLSLHPFIKRHHSAEVSVRGTTGHFETLVTSRSPRCCLAKVLSSFSPPQAPYTFKFFLRFFFRFVFSWRKLLTAFSLVFIGNSLFAVATWDASSRFQGGPYI